MRAGALAVLLVLGAGCGTSNTDYAPKQVERAFRAEGIVLYRATSNGAEQATMGEISGCPTTYVAPDRLIVWVCDDRNSASAALPNAASSRFRWQRANVVADYAGTNERVRKRIPRALDALG